MAERTLSDLLQEKESLKKTLIDIGVPISALDQVLQHIQNFQEIEKDLTEARATQFWNDAASISNVKGDRTAIISKFLRVFAEHVARETLRIADIHNMIPADIVDSIPDMESASYPSVHDSEEDNSPTRRA